MRRLNDMSELQLKEQLKAKLDASEPDRTAVLKIVNELEQRAPVKDIPTEAFVAWNALHSEEQKPRKSAWKAWAGAVAAVLALVMFVVSPALGAENIFQLIARWSESAFSLDKNPNQTEVEFKTNHEGLQQVYDVVQEIGITANVVPSWLPEEYWLEELIEETRPNGETVVAKFTDGTNFITYTVDVANENHDILYQKDDNDVEIQEYSGIQYYIFSNDGIWNIVWEHEKTECSLAIDDYALVTKIITSIHDYSMEE